MYRTSARSGRIFGQFKEENVALGKSLLQENEKIGWQGQGLACFLAGTLGHAMAKALHVLRYFMSLKYDIVRNG